MLKTEGFWMRLEKENNNITADALLSQILFASTVWSVHRAHVQKLMNNKPMNVEDVKNKALFGGIVELNRIMSNLIQKSKKENEGNRWKVLAHLIKRKLQVKKQRLATQLSKLVENHNN